MIITRLDGGLGNQMFQYAFGSNVSKLTGLTLKLDTRFLGEYRHYELGIFDIKNAFASEKELLLFDRRKLSILQKMFFKFRHNFTRTLLLSEQEGNENLIFLSHLPENIYLSGYWQNEMYFESIEPLVRDIFKFPAFIERENLLLESIIQHSESVSLHVRRGDYMLEQNKVVHGILPIDFYHNAISLIRKRLEDPVFIVFSDDVEWVKRNLFIEGKVQYSTHNSGNRAFRDMQLMSICKHNIIANSSFSWWGAWLNNNLEKIVVAPIKWFAQPEKNDLHKNILHRDWIRI